MLFPETAVAVGAPPQERERASGNQPVEEPWKGVSWTTTAMASAIAIRCPEPRGAGGTSGSRSADPALEAAVERAFGAFRAVEADCTRFRPSPLTTLNDRPQAWHRIPWVLFDALVEARRAHRLTGGLFDPRVLDRLVELGYDRTFSEVARRADQDASSIPGAGSDRTAVSRSLSLTARPGYRWEPLLVPGLRLVHLRGERVDLGGIGKGLALRMAAAQMRRAGRDFLIEAGGDVYAGGRGSAAAPWRIGVESPFGDGDGDPAPVAVLEVENTALATSSTRVRSWVRDGRTVHHLIDPRTGEPARSGLAAVTVMHPDPVTAEAWSKSLFVAGLDAVAEVCGHRGLAALWIDTEGRMNTSAGMEKVVAWRAS